MTSASNNPIPETPGEGSDQLDALRQAFARLPRGVSSAQFAPQALTVTVSREAGARGGTIARTVGRKLGWQVYNQELIEYLAHERHLRGDLIESLDGPASAWVADQLQSLLSDRYLSQNSSIVELARMILAIGVRGEAVILGRGAGSILPAHSTLNIRVIAPHVDRVAYMSQLERLTIDQAAEQVRTRDAQRTEFVMTHFHRKPADPYQYDLLVNSALLGEELSAELIARAALTKQAARGRDAGAPPATVPEPLG